MANLSVLSDRYATPEINAIFSNEETIVAERELWIAVMKAQRDLGVDISAETIARYEAVKNEVDLGRIKTREREIRHDVKAKIEVFTELAGVDEKVHLGMTSRDLDDNIWQMHILHASKLLLGRYVSVLSHFMDKVEQYHDIELTGRTHHQAAEPTLLGRRFAMWAEELYNNVLKFEGFIQQYPLRGIKGPMGTQFDMVALLGSTEKVDRLEKMVAAELGFSKILDATGQIYPRSMDYEALTYLALLSAACSNFAIGMRLMSGYDLVTEGFKPGQVGSSAMPHKMNTRSSERIWSLSQLVKMYAEGGSRLSGEQWEEGDVSDSALRRVIIPDAFYSSDGICETTLTVLNEMGAYPGVINAELDKYFPFMATPEILSLAVRSGVGRERAHSIIRDVAVSEALKMRQDGKPPYLAASLSENPDFMAAGITRPAIDSILEERAHFIGNAGGQIGLVKEKCAEVLGRYQAESLYEPRPIL